MTTVGYDDEIRLDHCAEQGLEVPVTIAGDEALCTPIEGASERLIQSARALLTAVYRLDIIEAAEESVADEEANVSYSLDFGSDLRALKQATELLQMSDPDGFAAEVQPATAL